MRIKELPVGSIKPYEKNPRKNDGAVNGVAESIKQFGFQQPIVIDKNGVIIAGHTRYKAALKLGLATVPCVYADQLTEEQVAEYRILDNKLNELASWDYQTLGDELSDFQFDFDSFDVCLPTFTYENFIKESTEIQNGAEESLQNSSGDAGATEIVHIPPQQKYEYDQEKVESEFKNIQSNSIHLTVHFLNRNDIVEFGRKLGLNLSPDSKVCYF